MEDNMKNNYQKLTGFHLKLIAMAAMTVDHTALILIPHSSWIYWVMRSIGRLAFPLYCFLLTEGFIYTRSRKKYLLRLGLSAVISEPFFDYSLYGTWIFMNYQNVFFTFFIGLSMLIGLEYFKKKENRGAQLGVFLAACIVAFTLRCDYDVLGIIVIYILYEYRTQFLLKTSLSSAMMLLNGGLLQGLGGLAFIPIGMYSGKPGRGTMKYFFYLFYPLHLILLYFVKLFIQP